MAVTAAPSIELKQGAAQGVADGGAKSALKGLRAELAKCVGKRLGIDCQALRFLKSSPKHIVLSLFPRGMYVAMHFAAAAQVLLRLGSGISVSGSVDRLVLKASTHRFVRSL
jgi:hypothetical protein